MPLRRARSCRSTARNCSQVSEGSKGRILRERDGDRPLSRARARTALRASRIAPQICRTRLVSCSRVRIPRGPWYLPAKYAVEEPEVKFGGREGFISLPEVHELQRLSNIP